MNRRILATAIVTAAALCTLVGSSIVSAENAHSESCSYELDLSGAETGRARVRIRPNKIDLQILDGSPDSLYTVWVDFESRATGELPADYPEEGIDRGVAPAFASTALVTEGMGVDPNGVITDENGDATAHLPLDYNLLAAGDAPVVHENLSMHGLNRVGGFWVRRYGSDPELEASLQLTDPESGLPLLARSTPAGITIVRHPDLITHGHTPGVGDVDHFSAFKGDFPKKCGSARNP